MTDFFAYITTAFALIFVIEGLLYVVFPDKMQRMMMTALAMPKSTLRNFGITMVLIGFALVYLIDLFSR